MPTYPALPVNGLLLGPQRAPRAPPGPDLLPQQQAKALPALHVAIARQINTQLGMETAVMHARRIKVPLLAQLLVPCRAVLRGSISSLVFATRVQRGPTTAPPDLKQLVLPFRPAIKDPLMVLAQPSRPFALLGSTPLAVPLGV